MAASLTAEKEVQWRWTADEQMAMEDIQKALVAAPSLVCDDDECLLELMTEQSRVRGGTQSSG